MRRALSILFSMAMMAAFVVPAAAEVRESTPDASTPQASPSANALQAGVTDYADEDDNMLTIDLTALDGDVDGIALTEAFDPEVDAGDESFVFEEEHDAPDDCRLIEFNYEGSDEFDKIFIGICADEDFGLWIIGTEQEAVEHVNEQFADGQTDLVPEGYEEVDLD